MPRTWQQSLKKLAIPARRAELHSSRSVSPDRLEKDPLCSLCLVYRSQVFFIIDSLEPLWMSPNPILVFESPIRALTLLHWGLVTTGSYESSV